MYSLGKPLPLYHVQASSSKIQECDYVFPHRKEGMQEAMKYLGKEKVFNYYTRYCI